MVKPPKAKDSLSENAELRIYIERERNQYTGQAELHARSSPSINVLCVARSPQKCLDTLLDALWAAEQGLDTNQLILPDMGDFQVWYGPAD